MVYIQEKVQCPICGEFYKMITKGHLKKHGLTLPEFEELYSDFSIASESLRNAARLKSIEQWNQEARDTKSIQMIQYNEDHPEVGQSHSEWLIEYCKDPEVLDVMSKRSKQSNIDNPKIAEYHSYIMRNSKAAKTEAKRQRGGHDIIMHHYLYDDADLSKYTIPMKRSNHGKMHRRMQLDGYKVAHINSVTDDSGLWGYKSW